METNTLILKYNDEEFKETGKWNGMDQLSEIYASTSPFAYVANNPVSMRDPDGRWMDANGHIDTSGNSNPFRDMAQSQMRMTQFMGRNPGEGGAGGYLAFGNTQAYTDLMTAFFNGGTAGISNKDGVLRWWTDYEDPDPTVTGIGALGMLKLKGYSDNIDFPRTTSSTTWWVNTAIGAAATANVPRTGVFQYNDLWHQTKTRGVSFAWQKKWKNPGAKYWRGQQVKGFQGARSLGTKLTAAGGVLLVADVAMSGQVKPSHIINGAMLGASMSGVGSIVAGAWFVVDMGTGGVNYLSGNGFTTLSDVIDQSEWGQRATVDMYDGLY